jgi:hypothetical protein
MEGIKVSILISAIREAFEEMSSERGWYQDLEITKTGAGSIMNRFKKGNLSLEKMADLLEAKGVSIDLSNFTVGN